jgi:hypothetical protein
MKERMDALGDRINWSEAAQRAFEREIAGATVTTGNSMEQVIERLRVSKQEYLKSEGERGRKDGHEWACKFASYEDLMRVSGADPEQQKVAHQIDEALGLDPQEGTSFWMNEEKGRIEYPSDEYAYGFWDAADDVFEEVKEII